VSQDRLTATPCAEEVFLGTHIREVKMWGGGLRTVNMTHLAGQLVTSELDLIVGDRVSNKTGYFS
jgi:hypothetical protein